VPRVARRCATPGPGAVSSCELRLVRAKAARQNKKIADAFASNFDDPERQWQVFSGLRHV
jgi:hypothetical protein